MQGFKVKYMYLAAILNQIMGVILNSKHIINLLS